MNKGINSIDEKELFSIISSESSKFQKRISREILGKKVSDISLRVLSKVNESLESSKLGENLRKHFRNSISPDLDKQIVRTLENGGVGVNFTEELSSIIHKYTSQEAYFRSNDLKKQFGYSEVKLSRKEIIDRISNTFESNDLTLELSESFTEEFEDLLKSQENELIDDAANKVKASIDDAEEKAEVTRTVINEFKEVSQKIKEEQDAMKPDEEVEKEEAEEALKFSSTEFIKDHIPVTAQRFTLEYEKGNFTKHKLVDMLLTLENVAEDFSSDKEFVKKRIQSIKNDVVNVKDFDPEKVEDLDKLFDKAIGDVDGTFSALRMIGFGRGNLPASKTDADTLNVMRKMFDVKSKDHSQRINDYEIIGKCKVGPIKSAEEMIDRAFEAFIMRSADVKDVADYEQHRKAIELRDEQVGEFLVDGLKHVPQERLERLKEINSGLKRLAHHEGLRQLRKENLQAAYYKTAKIVDPRILVDFKEEANRVKEMVAQAYSTDKYTTLVDDFFDETRREIVHVSEENVYELVAFKAAKEVSEESGTIDEYGKKAVKAYASAFTSYLTTLEKMNIINDEDIKKLAREIRKS